MTTLAMTKKLFLLFSLVSVHLFAQNTTIDEKLKKAHLKEIDGDYAAAIVLYSEVIQDEPRNDEAYVNRGISYLQLDNFAAALSDFTKAIKLNPANAEAYYNRAVIYSDIKEYGDEMAIADLTMAIGLNSDNLYAYLMRGFAYTNIGKIQEAYWDYASALQINPEESKSYYHMAVVTGIVKNEIQTCEYVYNQAIDGDDDAAKSVFLAFCAN